MFAEAPGLRLIFYYSWRSSEDAALAFRSDPRRAEDFGGGGRRRGRALLGCTEQSRSGDGGKKKKKTWEASGWLLQSCSSTLAGGGRRNRGRAGNVEGRGEGGKGGGCCRSVLASKL